jgi:hypothetical protein
MSALQKARGGGAITFGMLLMSDANQNMHFRWKRCKHKWRRSEYAWYRVIVSMNMWIWVVDRNRTWHGLQESISVHYESRMIFLQKKKNLQWLINMVIKFLETKYLVIVRWLIRSIYIKEIHPCTCIRTRTYNTRHKHWDGDDISMPSIDMHGRNKLALLITNFLIEISLYYMHTYFLKKSNHACH